MRPPRPTPRPCLGCGTRTEAKRQRCRACRTPLREDAELGLPDGRWVPTGRGIAVYRGVDGLPVAREEVA